MVRGNKILSVHAQMRRLHAHTRMRVCVKSDIACVVKHDRGHAPPKRGSTGRRGG